MRRRADKYTKPHHAHLVTPYSLTTNVLETTVRKVFGDAQNIREDEAANSACDSKSHVLDEIYIHDDVYILAVIGGCVHN